MRLEIEQCRQKSTGSCRGCPVLYDLLDQARMRAVYKPSSMSSGVSDLVNDIAERRCPSGMKPQENRLVIHDYGRSLAGRMVTVDLR